MKLRFTKRNAFRRIRFSSAFFLSLAAFIFCGCQSTKQKLFVVSGPGWSLQQGQATWRPKASLPEFSGDLILARDATGRCLIQFDKTPMAILNAQVTTNEWLISFPQRQMSFGGHGRGWTRFAWLYLPAALDGRKLPKDFHFERRADGGWRLENFRTGETVEGFLAP